MFGTVVLLLTLFSTLCFYKYYSNNVCSKKCSLFICNRQHHLYQKDIGGYTTIEKNITQQTHQDGSSQNDSDSEAVELDESIEQDTQETTDTLINIINNVYGDDADFSFGAQNEMSNFYKVIEYAKEE